MGKLTTQEKVWRGIDMAEEQAKSEERLKSFETSGIENMIESERKVLEKKETMVKKNTIASALLPQARIRVRMQNLREKFIKDSTMLGQFSEAVCRLDSILKASLPESVFVPFDDTELNELENEAWEKFRQAIKGSNEETIIDCLVVILRAVRIDLLFEELPPVRPAYFFKDKTYT